MRQPVHPSASTLWFTEQGHLCLIELERHNIIQKKNNDVYAYSSSLFLLCFNCNFCIFIDA